jgi:hypothetical protein
MTTTQKEKKGERLEKRGPSPVRKERLEKRFFLFRERLTRRKDKSENRTKMQQIRRKFQNAHFTH